MQCVCVYTYMYMYMYMQMHMHMYAYMGKCVGVCVYTHFDCKVPLCGKPFKAELYTYLESPL